MRHVGQDMPAKPDHAPQVDGEKRRRFHMPQIESIIGSREHARDDYAAKQINAPVYVISIDGICKIDPSGKITRDEGPEWMKDTDKRNCATCR